MRINRVLIVCLLIALALTYYEARLKPQSRPLYERALSLYRQQKYNDSLVELERAFQIEPNSTAILVLQGWDHFKLRQFIEARENFSRAQRLNPKLIEPQLGLAYLALETGHGEMSLAGARALLELEPGNADFQLAAAATLRQNGQNREAQKLFERLLRHSTYRKIARSNLDEMYGLEGLGEESPAGLPLVARPKELQVDFRAGERLLQRRSGNAWENLYVKGINLGAAAPGSFAPEGPTVAKVYLQWLAEISRLGYNTLRVYSILPPAFYRALKIHNETAAASKLYLLQGVWLVGSDETNLFRILVESEAHQEIARAIDVIHGQADVPIRKGHASGFYAVDVSFREPDHVLRLSG